MASGRESGTTGKASHRGHGGHRGGIGVGGQEFDRRQSWRLGENRAQRGKHRTEVTEVTEGGLGLVARNSIGDNMVFGRESGATGKASHRGHGGHRGGIGVGGQEFDRRQPWRLGENRAQRGKHRTEVTEVTEGGFGLVARNSIGDNHGVWARIGRNGESIAQRSRRSQRGDWGRWPGIRSVTTMAAGRESGATGKASHRGHGGGIWVGGQEFDRRQHGGWARIRRNGESIAQRSQRRDWGWWPGIRSATTWCLGENQVQRGKHRTEVTEGDCRWRQEFDR